MKLPEALPTLSGRFYAVYRVLWWVLLAATLVALTAGSWFTVKHGAAQGRAYYGAGIRLTQIDRRITFAPFGDETRGAFPPGSTLLAVDGRPVPDLVGQRNFDRIARALGDDDGRVIRLTLRTPAGAIRQVSVRRGPQHLAQSDRDAPMPYAARSALNLATAVIVSLLMVATGWLLFRRRPRDPVVALLSSGMLGAVAIVCSHTALGIFGAPEPVLMFVQRIFQAAIFVAIAVFPSGRFTPRISLATLPLIGLGCTQPWWPDGYEALGRSLNVALLVLVLAVVAWRFFKLPSGVERQQLKWAVLGIVAFIVLFLSGFAINAIDQQVNDNRLHFALLIGNTLAPTFALAALCAGLLVSLLRYRLYDADAAISRSATLAALTLALIAVFAGTEKLIEALGEEWFGASAGPAAGAIAAGFAAVLLVPLHHRLEHWAERRFQHNLVRLRKLPDLVGDLRETATLERLAGTALERIATTLRATGGAIVLANGETIARRGEGEDHPVRLPLADDACGTVGELRLGPRPDGTLYGKDEREALASVVGPVARALAIVRERGEVESRWQRLVSALESRLGAVEARLPPLGI